MRIQILTHHWVPNFGANLQATATYHFLKNMGHDVEVLNYRPSTTETAYQRKIPEAQLQAHEDHVKRFLAESPVLRTDQDIREYCQAYPADVIVVGSDAVLRVKRGSHTEDMQFPNAFWAQWARDLAEPQPRRCLLAASSMASNYFFLPKKTRAGIRKALLEFDFVSVRDRWTRWLVRSITGRRCDPPLCPDPTSVLNDSLQIAPEFCEEPASLSGKYVLLSWRGGRSSLSPAWVRRFCQLCHERGLEVYSLPLPEVALDLPVDRVLPLPIAPLKWYAWIQHAAGVIAMRFHPIACSIFNSVPFVSIDNNCLTYLRVLSIQSSSKSYDICRNVEAARNCVTPLRMRLMVSPENAMALLAKAPCEKMREYQHTARREFAAAVDRILAAGQPQAGI